MSARGWSAGATFVAALAAGAVYGQTAGADLGNPAPFGPPVDDRHIWVHGMLDQFEARAGGGDIGLRWDGEAWAGPDEWRVWLKSEGELTRGRVGDGQTEAFFGKPISTFFDVQVGGRYDLDSRPGRGWAAVGVEGLAPGFFKVAATAYAGDHGLAGKVKASYDQLITNRLILQPEAEVNLYSQDDPARAVGAGLSDLDAGVRLRYEITRKFAPYLGVTWEQKFGRTADLVRAAGEPSADVRLTLGVRAWF
ncbi:MAG: copper resistance protein B [Caulobacteraceae bacterium]|nr:copper resistance protein B [Caulobacteraceae bacterium]